MMVTNFYGKPKGNLLTFKIVIYCLWEETGLGSEFYFNVLICNLAINA